MSVNSFGAKTTLQVGEDSYEIFRLDAVEGSDSLRTVSRSRWRTCSVPRTASTSPPMTSGRLGAGIRRPNPAKRSNSLPRE